MFKGQKGVTLVALVVTIIVLLILAGVSISMVVGQNGILTRTRGSVDNQNAASAKEKISMAVSTLEMQYQTQWAADPTTTRADVYTAANVLTEIKNNGADPAEDKTSVSAALTATDGATVKVNGYTFTKVKIDADGALTMDADVKTPDNKTITLGQ
jgi:flagellar basal body-associated protein FliL